MTAASTDAGATFTPAEAAEHTGMSIDTLRYYEREGILPSVARTTGGRRAYTADDLGRLDFLRCLRDTGMPIAALRRYAELALDPTTLRERTQLLEEHYAVTEEAIAALQNQQRRLRHKIDWYHGQLGDE